MMSEHGVTHLVVVDHQSDEPLGIVSSSDVLAAYASAATN
jgi:CBS domain-containing protein